MGAGQSVDGDAHNAALLEFKGTDGRLFCNGQPFMLVGVNWFGSEAYNGPPGGLDKHSVEWFMDFLKANGFNAIRFLFTHEYVLKNDVVEAPAGEGPGGLLFQVRYVDMFGALARAAATRGLLVLVACHRVAHDAWPGKGLWYDDARGVPEAVVRRSWGIMASALCSHWNIFAVDLQNEPHASSWGKGLPTDWNKAAERIGDHVLTLCPRWLVFGAA